VIEPMDTSALTAGLRRFLEEPGYGRRLGSNAREWARGFSWRRCAAETYDEQ